MTEFLGIKKFQCIKSFRDWLYETCWPGKSVFFIGKFNVFCSCWLYEIFWTRWLVWLSSWKWAGSIALTHNISWLFDAWSSGITRQSEPIISPLTQCLSTPNLDYTDLLWEASNLKATLPFITWPTWEHIAFWKIYISTATILMGTKLDRVLTSGRSFSTQTLK